MPDTPIEKLLRSEDTAMDCRQRTPGYAAWPVVGVMALAGLAGCAELATPNAATGSGLIRARYTETITLPGEEAQTELEVIADGDRRTRVTVLSGPAPAGKWTVWDGRVLLEVVPGGGDDPYHRLDTPEELEGVEPPIYVFKAGTDGFARRCGNARHLGTHTLLGRVADRYACAAVETSAGGTEAHEMSLDQATGLVLRDVLEQQTVTATHVELNVTVAADTFSTNPPAGKDATLARLEFRLPRVGGGEIARAEYREPLVIVAGNAQHIRATVHRLLPLTADGLRPRVLGMLIAIPPQDWNGSLLNQGDARALADMVSKAAGAFPVPVAIDFKGAASGPITGAPGIEPGPAAIGFVRSDGAVVHVTTESATDAELRDQITGLK